MYVQGVSTRRVKTVIEQLYGTAISSSQVSRAAAQLGETLEAWRNSLLDVIRYLYLDARYEKVRVDGQIRDAAILIASGVSLDGKRQILGLSVSLGEQEVHWRAFLQSLVKRGLRGVVTFLSAFGVTVSHMTVWRDLQEQAKLLEKRRHWQPVRVLSVDGVGLG